MDQQIIGINVDFGGISGAQIIILLKIAKLLWKFTKSTKTSQKHKSPYALSSGNTKIYENQPKS